ncbi:hypothetical protein [Streptomyces sp. NPDC046197]|uniref:hypothetical protein n=1 Tax=Streptomyces sp. NPDC046197 TaxID=3154337 RepID=UPI0033E387B1
MIESQVPDLEAVSLCDLLDSDDNALRRGVLWAGAQADKGLEIAASGGQSPGGGAERID